MQQCHSIVGHCGACGSAFHYMLFAEPSKGSSSSRCGPVTLKGFTNMWLVQTFSSILAGTRRRGPERARGQGPNQKAKRIKGKGGRREARCNVSRVAGIVIHLFEQ